jgi:actin-related protein
MRLVIDNGSRTIKVGFGGQPEPNDAFPTMTAWQKKPAGAKIWVTSQRDDFVGNEAWSKRAICNVVYPIQRGKIDNWDKMEKLWHHSFYSCLRVTPEEAERTVVTIGDVDENVVKIGQIMFETFNLASLAVITKAASSFLACSKEKSTGVSIQSGEHFTQVVPIIEGKVVHEAVSKMNIGGSEIQQYLVKLLEDKKAFSIAPYEITSREKADIASWMITREKIAEVAVDYENDVKSADVSENIKTFTYPGPQTDVEFKVGSERLSCAELLLRPIENSSVQVKGIHDLIVDSISRCPSSAKEELFSNILISGGNAKIAGLSNRLQMELEKHHSGEVKIIADLPNSDARIRSWAGASELTALESQYDTLSVSKAEYDEIGPSIGKRFQNFYN